MTTQHSVRVTVNGVAYERTVEARLTLADFLREALNLTGTHLEMPIVEAVLHVSRER